MEPWLELVLSGNVGALIFAVVVIWRASRKMGRDESLKADYPPHRHINGKIIYPREYEPALTERLQ